MKSETIKINGVDTAIENSYISYLDTTRGYRTFGLDGIHRLGVLMYNGLAAISGNDQEAYSLWLNEFYLDSEDEDEESPEVHGSTVVSDQEWMAQFRVGSVRLSSRLRAPRS